MTNAVEFFCIDMDKAIGRSTDTHLDYVEDLLETYADISDFETMLIGVGFDASVYTDLVCKYTAKIICIDLFDALNMGFLTRYRWFTDNTLCYITDNFLGLFGMDIAINKANRESFDGWKNMFPFRIFF